MALPTRNADVLITLEGRDNASVLIEDSTKRITKQWRAYREESRAVERSFELNHRAITQAGRALSTLGSVIGRIRGVYNTYLLQQIRNAQIAENLADAHKNLNDAITETGLNSEETLQARKDLERVLQDEKNAVQEDALMWLFYAGAILQSFNAVTKLIPRLKSLAGLMGVKGGGGGASTPVSGLAQGPNLPKGTIGSGPTGGVGGMGLIGPTALAISVMEFALKSMGIEKQTGVAPKTSFQTLEDMQRILDQGKSATDAGGTIFGSIPRSNNGTVNNNIVINAMTSEELLNAIKNSLNNNNSYGQ